MFGARTHRICELGRLLKTIQNSSCRNRRRYLVLFVAKRVQHAQTCSSCLHVQCISIQTVHCNRRSTLDLDRTAVARAVSSCRWEITSTPLARLRHISSTLAPRFWVLLTTESAHFRTKLRFMLAVDCTLFCPSSTSDLAFLQNLCYRKLAPLRFSKLFAQYHNFDWKPKVLTHINSSTTFMSSISDLFIYFYFILFF